jgi:hypothetical protein
MGLEGLVIEAPRQSLSAWKVKALDQDQEPEASGDKPGDGIALTCP